MDEFNASDVLKVVTVYEAIDKDSRYTHKVRRLGEFCRKKYSYHKHIKTCAYCEGLMQTLIRADLIDSETLKQGVARTLSEMESLDWLVPPMLQKADTIFK